MDGKGTSICPCFVPGPAAVGTRQQWGTSTWRGLPCLWLQGGLWESRNAEQGGRNETQNRLAGALGLHIRPHAGCSWRPPGLPHRCCCSPTAVALPDVSRSYPVPGGAWCVLACNFSVQHACWCVQPLVQRAPECAKPWVLCTLEGALPGAECYCCFKSMHFRECSSLCNVHISVQSLAQRAPWSTQFLMRCASQCVQSLLQRTPWSMQFFARCAPSSAQALGKCACWGATPCAAAPGRGRSACAASFAVRSCAARCASQQCHPAARPAAHRTELQLLETLHGADNMEPNKAAWGGSRGVSLLARLPAGLGVERWYPTQGAVPPLVTP